MMISKAPNGIKYFESMLTFPDWFPIEDFRGKTLFKSLTNDKLANLPF